jgi:hypothetical protein
MGGLGLTVAARRVFLYRAAVPASRIDRKSDAGDGHVAEWLRSGLQNRLPRFNSGRGLQTNQWFRRREKRAATQEETSTTYAPATAGSSGQRPVNAPMSPSGWLYG